MQDGVTQEIYWGKHLWKVKGEGTKWAGEPQTTHASPTAVKGEREGTRQFPAAADRGSSGRASGSPQAKAAPWESYTGQWWSSSCTRRGKSLAGAAWRGGRGECGFGVNATVGLKASQSEALGYAPCGGFLWRGIQVASVHHSKCHNVR